MTAPGLRPCSERCLDLVHCHGEAGSEVDVAPLCDDDYRPQDVCQLVPKLRVDVSNCAHALPRLYKFREVTDVTHQTQREFFSRPLSAVGATLMGLVQCSNRESAFPDPAITAGLVYATGMNA